MSEELLQKGYIHRGRARGESVGPYEGFNLGATTLDQLPKYGIIPDRSYGRHGKNKPDGLVVDRAHLWSNLLRSSRIAMA